MRELTTQISHEELIDAWAPIVDVSRTLDRIIGKVGGGNVGEILGIMDAKVKCALEPLQACIKRLEAENPKHFS